MDNYKKTEIDTDIPVPPTAGAYRRLPWRDLGIGESIFIDDDPKWLRSNKTKTERRYGIKLASRKEGSGRRFWRIA